MGEGFKKSQQKLMNCRSYEHFSKEACRETLTNTLSQGNFVNNNDSFQRFCDITVASWASLAILKECTPCKIKRVRGNQMSFFDEELSKAI